MLKCRLAKLRSDLRRRVVHKLPIRAKNIAARPGALLLVWIPAIYGSALL
jgi:hypothetical protein